MFQIELKNHTIMIKILAYCMLKQMVNLGQF